MSHYTVAVITQEPYFDEVENLLEPFDENIEVEPYIYLTKEEIIQQGKDYKNKLLTETFPKADTKTLLRLLEPDNAEYISSYLKAETDEDFYELECKDCDGEDFDLDGNLYTTYNPNSKWDWYQIGGRWSCSLKPKNENKWCDSCQISELDWDAEDKDHYKFESTYAILLPNGEWIAPGKMGWWGISSEKETTWKWWHEHYKENLLKITKPEWYITIVDCHI